ncbi:hypothetical protein SBF1_3850005 [Candidatus Desulfosporosinus infrequens]|uniref:Uncharacterized protein n=1 Tax=Candidatus Desulfosporosinus infrequens TaxID=2043169 RepID=A0A2U3L678_9FIRM|nr:hypothetical protein SBF1_3850005 [Candidatus Desulfosporosinus infrequens]
MIFTHNIQNAAEGGLGMKVLKQFALWKSKYSWVRMQKRNWERYFKSQIQV